MRGSEISGVADMGRKGESLVSETGNDILKTESRRGDLNPRPADYESAAIPLSHGGAIPHNIGVCANKFYGLKNYEYPLSAVTFSLPGFSLGAIVPNLPS
jgi:hypothetical protein